MFSQINCQKFCIIQYNFYFVDKFYEKSQDIASQYILQLVVNRHGD